MDALDGRGANAVAFATIVKTTSRLPGKPGDLLWFAVMDCGTNASWYDVPMWQFSTPLMIYVAMLLTTGAALSNALGSVLPTAFSVILVVGALGLLLLVLTVYVITRLLGSSED